MWVRGWWVLALILSLPTCSLGQTSQRYFAHKAEGFSSPDERRGVTAAPKMFLAPDNVCATAPRAARLSMAQRIELHVGKPFPINDLIVVARDSAGAAVPRVPIAIEVEVVEPPVLNPMSNALPENHLHPIRPGTFRLRARTICGDRPINVFMLATIR